MNEFVLKGRIYSKHFVRLNHATQYQGRRLLRFYAPRAAQTKPKQPPPSSSISEQGIVYNYFFVRAGHKTTLPRQRDHVFRREKNCWFFYFCMSIFLVATPFRHQGLNIVSYFTSENNFFLSQKGRSTVLRCRVVAVAKLSNCCVPIFFSIATLLKVKNHSVSVFLLCLL